MIINDLSTALSKNKFYDAIEELYEICLEAQVGDLEKAARMLPSFSLSGIILDHGNDNYEVVFQVDGIKKKFRTFAKDYIVEYESLIEEEE